MLRVITVLTVLAAVAVLAGAGQTRETQESVTPAVQLVAQYDKLVSHKNQVARRVLCKGTKAYLNAKRKATWKWEDSMYVSRTPTSYRDRRTKCSSYLRWQSKLWATRAAKRYQKYSYLQRNPRAAICHIFGSYCSQALAVSWCEAKYYVWAHNGQYLGMFQMGSSEREKFGHGSTPLEQSYAAHKYFVASGRDWSPWSCKPYR